MSERDPHDAEQDESQTTWDVETESGIARIHYHQAQFGSPRATLVLGHGAGRGVDARDLAVIAAALPADGVEVLLVEQPWHVAGRKTSSANGKADRAWTAALADVRNRGLGVRRLVVGGRSTGARVACRTVEQVRPDALFLLAFPLQPPMRRLETPPSRLPELIAAAEQYSTVVVQGERDSFGTAGQIAVGLAEAQITARVVPVPSADHGFKVPARIEGGQQAALDLIVRAARATALKLEDRY